MNYRVAELLATSNKTASGTETINIDFNDVISRLLVIAECTNGDYVPDGHPAAMITGIKVVDGSEVIASLTGRQCQAAAWYGAHRFDHNEINYENNGVCRAAMSLFFGRDLFDVDYALDPKRFRNLQLQISHNYAAGGASPASMNLRVLADMFDEKVVSPKGYMLTKEHFKFTPAAGAAVYVDLPTSEPIRMLLIQCPSDSEEIDIQANTVRIDEEDGKRVICDLTGMDIIRIFESQYPRMGDIYSGRFTTSSRYVWSTFGKDINLAMIEQNAVDTYVYATWSGGLKREIKAGAEVEIHGHLTGRCVQNAFPILFGQQNNPADWWDMRRVGKARCKITPSSATGDATTGVEVITQQEKLY
jgi:hypothetical protein